MKITHQAAYKVIKSRPKFNIEVSYTSIRSIAQFFYEQMNVVKYSDKPNIILTRGGRAGHYNGSKNELEVFAQKDDPNWMVYATFHELTHWWQHMVVRTMTSWHQDGMTSCFYFKNKLIRMDPYNIDPDAYAKMPQEVEANVNAIKLYRRFAAR